MKSIHMTTLGGALLMCLSLNACAPLIVPAQPATIKGAQALKLRHISKAPPKAVI